MSRTILASFAWRKLVSLPSGSSTDYQLSLNGPHAQVVSCIFPERIACTACFRTHTCQLNELHANANWSGRCPPAKVMVIHWNGCDCRPSWASSRGSCARYTPGHPPALSTGTGIPKSAANGVPLEAFCSSIAAVLHPSQKCPLQSVNRKWKMNESS